METLHAEEEEEEGKRIVARLSEKKINSGIQSLISKKFLRLQEGTIGKNPTTTPNPSRNKPSPPKKKSQTEKNAQPNLRHAFQHKSLLHSEKKVRLLAFIYTLQYSAKKG